MLHVLMFHNISDAPTKWMHGIAAGDPLRLAYTYAALEPELFVGRSSDLSVCEQAYAIGNMDPGMGSTVAERAEVARYRDRGNRSLSVGDVVAVQRDDGAGVNGVVFYACDSIGFRELDPGMLDESVIEIAGQQWTGREMMA